MLTNKVPTLWVRYKLYFEIFTFLIIAVEIKRMVIKRSSHFISTKTLDNGWLSLKSLLFLVNSLKGQKKVSFKIVITYLNNN